MKDYKEQWFQDNLESMEEVELKSMESQAYLDAERKLDEAKEAILQYVPDSDKEAVSKLLNEREECGWLMYNTLVKNTVCAAKFGEIEF